MSRRRGNNNENAFMDLAAALGYCAFAARGSRGIVDVVCFQSEQSGYECRCADCGEAHSYDKPALAVQVGTTAKPIAATLAELDTAPRPIGSRCIVARRHLTKSRRVKWTFHDAAGTYDSLAALLEQRP